MKDKSMAVLGIGTAQALGFLSFFLLPKAYDSSSAGEIYRKTLRKSLVWLCSAQLVHHYLIIWKCYCNHIAHIAHRFQIKVYYLFTGGSITYEDLNQYIGYNPDQKDYYCNLCSKLVSKKPSRAQ